MGFASKVFFLLGLAAAVATLPAQAVASPAAERWPTVVQVKGAVRCSWSEDAKNMSCLPRGCDATLDMVKSSRGNRIVRLEMVVIARYDERDRRAERRNIACAKKVLDLFLPAWKDRHAWFDAAVSRALKTWASSAKRVGRKRISVDYERASPPADYVDVVIE